MNTNTRTVTFTPKTGEPWTVTVSKTVTVTFDGEEVYSKATAPTIDAQKVIFQKAQDFANVRSELHDFSALRTIRDEFAKSSDRLMLATQFASKGVNGDEFLGLLLANGQTKSAAEAIYGGINASLGQRGEANL